MKGLIDLKHFIEGLKHLPTISPVALRIVEVADNEECSIGEITKLVESDQALSSKILQISNYTLVKSERQGEAKTVKHATAILGMDMVRSIALSLIVVNLFESSSDDSFNVVEFWRHCAACAIASDLFARQFSCPKPEEAFIAGLLHDLGKLILFHWKKDKYKKLAMDAKAAKLPLLELEEKHLEIGHTQAAKLLMKHWKFPQSLTNAAWLHHQPLSEFGSDRLNQLPFIVKCANSLCHIQRFGDSSNPIGDMDHEQLEQVTGLSTDAIDQLSSEILNLFKDVAENYDWKVSTPQLYLSAVSRANQELFHQKIDLKETKRQLTIQQHLNNLIYELQESLSLPVSISQALEKITNMLGEVIPYKRVMGFVLLEESGFIEGWIKLNSKSDGERINLPLNTDSTEGLAKLRLREQVSLIERIVEQSGNVLPSGSEILKALISSDLKVQPLYIEGKTIGLIMIELAPLDWSQHEKTIFLRKYALAAAMAMGRLILSESLDQQTEELARLARKTENLHARINELEGSNQQPVISNQ